MPCGIGAHMSRLRHPGWNHCSHGLTSRPLESCHHQCLKAVCGVLGCPKGPASELLDAPEAPTLYFHYSTRFPPWSLPEVGNGSGKRQSVTPGHLQDEGSNTGNKTVRLTRKTRPGALVTTIRIQGIQRASQSFSSTWGWVIVCTGDAWNLPSEGTGVGSLPPSPPPHTPHHPTPHHTPTPHPYLPLPPPSSSLSTHTPHHTTHHSSHSHSHSHSHSVTSRAAVGPRSSPQPQCWTVEEESGGAGGGVHEARVAQRELKTPPPRTRPGVLTKPAPQVRLEAAAR